MKKEHIAHITTIDKIVITQTVKQHCTAVAKYAAESLKGIGLYHTAYLAGLTHDMGKTKDEFTIYLKDAHVKGESGGRTVNHSFAAVIYLLDKHHKEKIPFEQSITAELIAYACGAHHGAFDIVDLRGGNGFEHRITKEKAGIHYEEAKENFFRQIASEQELDDLFHEAVKEVDTFYRNLLSHSDKENEIHFALGTLSRIILSAVIDGDRRDTMEFSIGRKVQYKKMTTDDWEQQLTCLEAKIKEFKTDSDINRVRKKISDQCRDAAARDTGLYRISVPTGAGKTLATLRYALAHAAETGKERVIFIIPLLSVLDQNSKVIHEYLGNDDLILEHHSDVVHLSKTEEDCLDKRELLLENWESPVIISTLVQLLNTCFSHKNSSIRRLKSLCNSVIVIDEIQSLPIKFTNIFNQVINFLTENCNSTIVLSSATQPCFERVSTPMRVSENGELVKLSDKDREVFKRVSLENRITPEGVTLEEVAEFTGTLLATKDSVLIVCNTKAEARNLYRMLEKSRSEELEIYHLSTSMCKANRKVVLDKIGKTPGLNSGKKVICVSTQLVEAGIDFSFEAVIRFVAGIENIIQAVGRCNRNNEWGNNCQSYVVKIKAEKLGSLEEIKTRQHCFDKVSVDFKRTPEKFENNLVSLPIVQKYYTYLFEENQYTVKFPVKIDEMGFEISDMLAHFDGIIEEESGGRYWMRQPFKTAGVHCKVFDDNTIDVIVPFGTAGKAVIANLCSREAQMDAIYLKNQIEKAKPYTVSLYDHEMKKLGGMITSIANDSLYVYEKGRRNLCSMIILWSFRYMGSMHSSPIQLPE